LREITEHYQIPLIFDEVVTGFRFGYGGAQEYYGVTPDICSLGKAVAGGFPLTAIAGREEIMAHMDSGSVDSDAFMPQIGTLSGNPIAASAGLKTLEILRREGTYEKIFATGNRIKEALQRLLDEAEIPAKVIGESSLFDVFFTETEVTNYRSTLEADTNLMAKFNSLLFEQGIFKGASKFYISAAHTEEDVDKTIAAFETVVDQLRG
jgi:glutamate-1-semialdehyde 2,1-aminomutase